MYGHLSASKLEACGTARLKKFAALCAATMLLAGCGHQQVRGTNPVQPGPPQMVHLIWKQATNEWQVQLDGNPPVKPAAAETKLGRGVGPTTFVVDVVGPTPPTFKDPGGLDIWEGDKTKPQSGIKSTQILGPVITKQGKMIFWDLNQGDPVKLSYSLHFNEAGIPSVDPIIDNGGGN